MERKEILVVVLIGVLLLSVGLQTIQLAGLARAEVVAPVPGSAVKSASPPSSSPSVPTNLKNLPSMVGGC